MKKMMLTLLLQSALVPLPWAVCVTYKAPWETAYKTKFDSSWGSHIDAEGRAFEINVKGACFIAMPPSLDEDCPNPNNLFVHVESTADANYCQDPTLDFELNDGGCAPHIPK